MVIEEEAMDYFLLIVIPLALGALAWYSLREEEL
jgi:hypothetical protein